MESLEFADQKDFIRPFLSMFFYTNHLINLLMLIRYDESLLMSAMSMF
jgi:hypothetical protein